MPHRLPLLALVGSLVLGCGGHAHAQAAGGFNGKTVTVYIAFGEQPGRPVFEWHEPMHWTKSPKLVLMSNEPVPLVGWPGTLSERLATKLLGDAQISYNVVFTGADHASRKAAVAAGLGLMLMMKRAMTPDVVIADEPFLPPAPIVKTGIYAREGLNIRRIMPLVQILEGLLRPPPAPTLVAAPAKVPAGEKPARRRRA